MRLNPKEIKGDLYDLLETTEKKHTIRQTLEYIRQLEGELRRAGITEYNDPKESENQ